MGASENIKVCGRYLTQMAKEKKTQRAKIGLDWLTGEWDFPSPNCNLWNSSFSDGCVK